MKIGLQNPANTSLHGGPAVFTDRLTSGLTARGLYSDDTYDTWMNLAFRRVPDKVLEKQPRIVIRFDGTWNMAAWPFWGRRPGPFSPVNTLVYRYLNRILRRNIDLADGFIFQSDFSREMICRLYGDLPEKPARTIFNGVDLGRFSPFEGHAPEVGSGEDIRILVSHKHWAVKRSWLVPKVISALKNRTDRPIIVRVIGGDTSNPLPCRPSPLEMMRKNALCHGVEDNFDFVGHIPPDELPDQYRWAHLMLNLSFADPCPNVVVEALASGLPVVGPASGGLAELVDEKRWLIDSGEDPFLLYNPYVYSTFPGVDDEVYARTILDIAENLTEERSRARRRAELNFDINHVVDDYVEVLTGEGA